MRFALLSVLAVTGVAAMVACTPPLPATTGASDFADLCAPCHGPAGKGDGPMAADLIKRPADLTTLAARNDGAFPMVRVMNKIWGYSRGEAAPSMMPKFEPLLDGATVLIDMGDGVQTPTPQRLFDLAEYLTTIQG